MADGGKVCHVLYRAPCKCSPEYNPRLWIKSSRNFVPRESAPDPVCRGSDEGNSCIYNPWISSMPIDLYPMIRSTFD